MSAVYPVCKHPGKCFARKMGRCEILQATTGEVCKFQKPEREVTNGRRYEYRPETCCDASYSAIMRLYKNWE